MWVHPEARKASETKCCTCKTGYQYICPEGCDQTWIKRGHGYGKSTSGAGYTYCNTCHAGGNKGIMDWLHELRQTAMAEHLCLLCFEDCKHHAATWEKGQVIIDRRICDDLPSSRPTITTDEDVEAQITAEDQGDGGRAAAAAAAGRREDDARRDL